MKNSKILALVKAKLSKSDYYSLVIDIDGDNTNNDIKKIRVRMRTSYLYSL